MLSTSSTATESVAPGASLDTTGGDAFAQILDLSSTGVSSNNTSDAGAPSAQDPTNGSGAPSTTEPLAPTTGGITPPSDSTGLAIATATGSSTLDAPADTDVSLPLPSEPNLAGLMRPGHVLGAGNQVPNSASEHRGSDRARFVAGPAATGSANATGDQPLTDGTPNSQPGTIVAGAVALVNSVAGSSDDSNSASSTPRVDALLKTDSSLISTKSATDAAQARPTTSTPSSLADTDATTSKPPSATGAPHAAPAELGRAALEQVANSANQSGADQQHSITRQSFNTASAAGSVNTALAATPTTAPVHAVITAPDTSTTPPSAHVLPGVASQLVRTIAPLRQAPDGTQSVTISLHPADLGAVHVAMTLQDGHTLIRISAATSEGASAIRSSLQELETKLSEDGANTTVILEGQTTTAGNSGGNAQDARSWRSAPSPPQGTTNTSLKTQSSVASVGTPSAIPSSHLIDLRI